ncbi:MAG: GNAT family N-acetyltransferase, partial [Nanoarchaeota archaeon]|nr:GNAT family N-acetyltransferase [Nanoarchaeota archaeon]
GEMGTSMFWTKPNNLFNQTLKKFEKKLMDEKFTGYIDLNCIANESGIYPLEFTTRFGYPTIFIQAEGITEPIGGFLYKIASGEQNEFKTKPGFQIGVRIVVPPFPFNDDETFKVKSKGSMIYLKGSTEGIHIEDVKIIKNKWVVAGTSGVVMTICGTGNSIREAQEQAYSRIKTVNIPRMYYRTDIGDRWYSDRDKLNDWGYISDINRMRFKGLNENNLKEYQLLIVESENLYPEALRTSFEDFKDILSAPNSIGLIAFIDEHYIGNCVGSEPSDSDLKDLNIKLFSKDDKIIYVYNLIVTEQFQGKGYGQRLMDEFIKKAKAADYKYVLGNFRQNASYKITKKYKVVIEKLFKNWEDSGEDFVFCVMEI